MVDSTTYSQVESLQCQLKQAEDKVYRARLDHGATMNELVMVRTQHHEAVAEYEAINQQLQDINDFKHCAERARQVVREEVSANEGEEDEGKDRKDGSGDCSETQFFYFLCF